MAKVATPGKDTQPVCEFLGRTPDSIKTMVYYAGEEPVMVVSGRIWT